MLSRRAFLASTLLAAVPPTRAQQFPNALVRIIVPAAPGGGTDILARAMSGQLQALWGQTVIVENRSGASGLIGTRSVITAPGDGHTLLMAATSAIMALAVNAPEPELFDVSRDLAPITLVAAPPYILVAHPSVPATNAAELIAYAKKNPGKISYGSSGAGAASHLSGALFAQMAGIDMLHVPYRGMGPAVPDLLGGRIQLIFAPALTVTEFIATGKLRMIGTTGGERSRLFPDFPTIAESGLPDYYSLGWFGLFAAASTPPDLVGRIGATVGKVLFSEEFKKRLAEQGAEPEFTTADMFTDFVNADIRKWLDLAKRQGITLGGG
jgi:tripartite-type tricarboxylate transporter receptor subunit TctC